MAAWGIAAVCISCDSKEPRGELKRIWYNGSYNRDFKDLNDLHLAEAKRIGIKPATDREEAEKVKAEVADLGKQLSEKEALETELEAKVNELIRQDLPVTYVDNYHVAIDGQIHPCTGPRIHVSRTGMIENFHLLHHFVYDRFKHQYLLVGCVGDDAIENLKKLDAQQEMQSDLIL